MKILCLLLAPLLAFGAQSIVLTGVNYSASIPNSGPFTVASVNSTSQRYQVRIHDYATPASNKNLWYLNGGSIVCQFDTSGGYVCNDLMDTPVLGGDLLMGCSNGGSPCNSGMPDFVSTLVRDVAHMQLYMVVCNVQLTSCFTSTAKTIGSLGGGSSPYASPSTIAIGNAGAGLTADMRYLRWRSGLGACTSDGSPYVCAPKDFDSAADWGDWEFQGNGNDSSGNGNNFSVVGATYVTTPTYPPSCSIPQQSFRAGEPATLDGSNCFSLNGASPTLSYLWQQDSSLDTTGLGNTNLLSWSSHTVSSPVVNGGLFGSYSFRVTVTDSTDVPASFTVKDGWVATDSGGNVIIPSASHAQILGQMQRLGSNLTWPWFDARQKAFAGLQLVANSTAPSNGVVGYLPFWDTPGPGTVTVFNASDVVTGTSTTFQTTFCGGVGNTTPTTVDGETVGIIIWYPSLLYTGTYGRITATVVECTTQTSMKINYGNSPSWFTTSTIGDSNSSPGWGSTPIQLNYTYSDKYLTGFWGLNAAPADYYDSAVMGMYATYYRTGIDDYLLGARQFADRFWHYILDRGAPYSGSTGFAVPQNRSMSLTGMFMRALDTPPEDMWPGLRQIMAYFLSLGGVPNQADSQLPVGDVRENSYEQLWLALAATYDPDTSSPQTCTPVGGSPVSVSGMRGNFACRTNSSMTNKWVPYHETVGNWRNFIPTAETFYGWNSSGTNLQPIEATAGSTSVIGHGTSWSAIYQPAASAWSSGTSYGYHTIVTYGGVWYLSIYLTAQSGHQPDISPTYWQRLDAAYWLWIGNYVGPPMSSSPVGYHATFVDDTHLTLDQPFQNPPGVDCSVAPYCWWQLSIDYAGSGTQPYMMGIAAKAMAQTNVALSAAGYTTNANLAKQYIDGIASWLKNVGQQVSTDGLYYARGFYNCEPDPSITCGGDNTLSMESINTIALSKLYGSTYDPTLTTLADLFMQGWCLPAQACYNSVAWNATGGNAGDTGFYYDLSVGARWWKWLGYFWGVDSVWQWPSAKDGGLAPVDTKTVTVTFYLPGVPGSTQVKVYLTDPTGTVASPVVCSVSPCSLTADARNGQQLMRVDYWDGSKLLRRGFDVPITIQ